MMISLSQIICLLYMFIMFFKMNCTNKSSNFYESKFSYKHQNPFPKEKEYIEFIIMLFYDSISEYLDYLSCIDGTIAQCIMWTIYINIYPEYVY
jgi:hypothetical protein